MPVIANIVLGHGGAAVIHGSSRELSSSEDRRRFREVRSRADAIVIGGQTARNEPYRSTPIPLLISSRGDVLPEAVRENPLARVIRASPQETIRIALDEFETILVEAGPNFLAEALSAGLVDDLYITRVERSGTAPFFTADLSALGYSLVEECEGDGERFQRFARLPTTTLP